MKSLSEFRIFAAEAEPSISSSQKPISRPLPKGPELPEAEAESEPVGDSASPSHVAAPAVVSPPDGSPWPLMGLLDRPPLLAGIADPLDFLSRMFPRMKRSVLQLMLSGCEGDLMRAIDRVISSGERPEPLLPPGLPPTSFFGPAPPPRVAPLSSETADGLCEAPQYSPFPGLHFPGPPGTGPDPMAMGALTSPRYPLLPPAQPFPRALPLSFPYPSFLPPMPVSMPYSSNFPIGGPSSSSKS